MDPTTKLVYKYFISPSRWAEVEKRIGQVAMADAWRKRQLEIFFEAYAVSKEITEYTKQNKIAQFHRDNERFKY